MNRENICFNRDITNALKAVFLMLMYVLHFFCFPAWYVGGYLILICSGWKDFKDISRYA